MRNVIRVMQVGTLASAVLAASAAGAAPTQTLLSQDFQGVTVGAAGTVVPLGTLGTVVVTGDASATSTVNSVNVRRDDNTINSTAGANGFDSFFAPISAAGSNKFLVIGDDTGNFGGTGAPGGGALNSTMSVSFALPTSMWALPYLAEVNGAFDYVFDATNAQNRDDFLVELVLADSSVFSITNLTQPTVGTGTGATRGTVTWSLSGPLLTAVPASLRFTLVELADDNPDSTTNPITNSAVGIDNIRVTAVPEPGTLALLGLALLSLAGLQRRASISR